MTKIKIKQNYQRKKSQSSKLFHETKWRNGKEVKLWIDTQDGISEMLDHPHHDKEGEKGVRKPKTSKVNNDLFTNSYKFIFSSSNIFVLFLYSYCLSQGYMFRPFWIAKAPHLLLFYVFWYHLYYYL